MGLLEAIDERRETFVRPCSTLPCTAGQRQLPHGHRSCNYGVKILKLNAAFLEQILIYILSGAFFHDLPRKYVNFQTYFAAGTCSGVGEIQNMRTFILFRKCIRFLSAHDGVLDCHRRACNIIYYYQSHVVSTKEDFFDFSPETTLSAISEAKNFRRNFSNVSSKHTAMDFFARHS